MSNVDSDVSQPSLIKSEDHAQLLDTIDKLRAAGVSHYVPLPQLIVCGDQSSGKSSVLEAVSGVRFPTSDSLCTRFATELVLRRAKNVHAKVEIRGGASISHADDQDLPYFSAEEVTIEEIPTIIAKAKAAMKIGVKGLLTDHTPAFSDSVLRVEISGPDKPHITLVDLPGVFHSKSKQQNPGDVELVKRLVKSYMKESRSIILAVVSAQNDYPNQVVTEFAHDADPKGDRTLGIITKPDTLPKGSDLEKNFFMLAKNEDVFFRLGWHVLKNRKYEERDCSTEERDKIETDFFSEGIWRELPNDRRGITTLRTRLSEVLKKQIISELPSLMQQVDDGIKDCKYRLGQLGRPRSTIEEQRLYLVNISQYYGSTLKAALDGSYSSAFFGNSGTDEGKMKRLRAVIQNHLAEFKEDMLLNGHFKQIVDNVDPSKKPNAKLITRTKYISEVQKLLHANRGKELPGLFNPVIVGDLFYQQAKPWLGVARRHLILILEAIRQWIDVAIFASADESTTHGLRRHIFTPTLNRYDKELREKVRELLKPNQRGHPITYSPHFAKEFHSIRKEHAQKETKQKLMEHFRISTESELGKPRDLYVDFEALLAKLTEKSEEELDFYACSEATDCMLAYYQTALQVFIDNFATLAIENCLVERLADIFTPEIVLKLSDRVVEDIATEAEESRLERSKASSKLERLANGLAILETLNRYKAATETVPDNSHLRDQSDASQPDKGAVTFAQAVEPVPTGPVVTATLNNSGTLAPMESSKSGTLSATITPASKSRDASPRPFSSGQPRASSVLDQAANNPFQGLSFDPASWNAQNFFPQANGPHLQPTGQSSALPSSPSFSFGSPSGYSGTSPSTPAANADSGSGSLGGSSSSVSQEPKK